MVRLLVASFAVVLAALAISASADATSIHSRTAGRAAMPAVSNAWRSDASSPGCRIELRLKRDFAGKPYVKKVRICA